MAEGAGFDHMLPAVGDFVLRDDQVDGLDQGGRFEDRDGPCDDRQPSQTKVLLVD